MTGTDVEFLDEQPSEPDSRPQRAQGSTHGTAALDWLAIAGWTVAAALGAVASLTNVFTYRLNFSAVHSRGGYTAMGRSLDPTLQNDSGTNYAVILIVCVVAFALLGLTVFRDTRTEGGTGLGRFAPAAGIGAAALLVGGLANIALGLVSSFASYRTLADTLDEQQSHAVQLSIGPCLWFGIAAFVVAVGALVVTIVRTPRAVALPHRSEAPPACGTPQHVPSRSDETDA